MIFGNDSHALLTMSAILIPTVVRISIYDMKHVNPHIGRVGMQILVLVAVAGFVTTVAIFPGISVAIAPFIKKKRYPKKQFVEKNIESLLAHGLLKRARPKAGKERLMLTTKGRWELGIRGFAGAENASKTKPDKWDDTWRIIIFDVPESKRKLRSELRRAVRMYGFTHIRVMISLHSLSDI